MGWREIEDHWSDLTRTVAELLPGSDLVELEKTPAKADVIVKRLSASNELTTAEVEEVLLARVLPRHRAHQMPMAAE